MSTNTPLETIPDPETQLLPEISTDGVLPSLLPVFDDIAANIQAQRYPELYDETTGIAQLQPDSENEPVPIGRTWLFDFNSGEFIMSGNAPKKSPNDEQIVLQQWIRRALSTERYGYIIYPDWFGIELNQVVSGTLTGQAAHDHIATQVRETLIMHDRISDVIDIVATQENGILYVSMTVLLDREEVAFDVTEKLRIY